ncbi:MAG: hypothetical protein KAJ19_17665, partial [Gammaproteobacteria bacterium]|nr:hypothetical protein [Gammaproteobacteria bacterium]
MSEPQTMHKDIMPDKGMVYKGALLVDGVTSTNAYQYSDPFELRIIPGRQCVMVVEETGSVNGVTVVYQGRVMTGI